MTKPSETTGKLTVKKIIERCTCGSELFYITKAREVYCASCRIKIPNTTVYTSPEASNKETLQ